jgi:hypothetical protein
MMVGLGAITVSGGRTARAAHCKYLLWAAVMRVGR